MVYTDKNGNGKKDADEAGIPNVVVSDQLNVAVTDAGGVYHLDHGINYPFVFVSVPSGFASKAHFWQNAGDSTSGEVNFPLEKTAEQKEFTFIQGSDTHISPASVDRMQKFRSTIDSLKPQFVIVTGDLVKDALRVNEKEATSYYELYRDEAGKIKVPVWNVPGNHENFGIERQLSLVSPKHPLYGRNMFHHYFGPDYYSFNYGGIHFVGLNSVEFEDTWYYGHVDSIQLAWLEKDLASIPNSMPIVTFNHIPFFSGGLSFENFTEFGFNRTVEVERGVLQYRHVVSNAKEVFDVLLKHHFALALAGHHHSCQQFIINTESGPVRLEQTAAIVGPSEDGGFNFPSGVTLYHVKNGIIDSGKFIPLDPLKTAGTN